MPKATPIKLTRPCGRWIMGSHACKQFQLAASDLESILPISDERNPNNSTSRIKKYNVADVRALAERLRSNSNSSASGSSSTATLAVASGPKIIRTNAMKEFKLVSCQMDRIKPVKMLPNPHRAGQFTKWYNRCDVKALADSIAQAAAVPARPFVSYHEEEDDDYNPFDGMSGEEAAFKLAEWTGITGPAMAYCHEYN
ncbi:hypothetical protein C8F04DRAFT_1172843 [Mycena alexandri]|uniref:Uncharacterized protein n=1 Tax=Mycena alexandri TaxID=1745969 RepID=A0AAD6TK74_9AGAR|nr:hypothetical protein C8F04DRAFT_1172843 [Mycena alexandri]